MVQLNSTFEEGGPRFSSWRVGFGFGKRCRSYMDDPSLSVAGRATPSGANYYRENRLWKGKWEKTREPGFGFGERPDYGKAPGGVNVSPAQYGDVAKKLGIFAVK